MAGKVRLTLEQLKEYNGSDPNKPIYLAIRGKIYDVSKGRDFYGQGGPYNAFAGKECARALALMRVTDEECSGDLTGLDEKQLGVLADWESKLAGKYSIVGEVSALATTSDASAGGTRSSELTNLAANWSMPLLFMFCAILLAFFLDTYKTKSS